MGQRLVALGSADPALRIVAGIDHSRHPRLGHDLGLLSGVGELGVPLTPQLGVEADVVIDFSVPAAVEGIVATCIERRLPLVVATTGLSPEQRARMLAAASQIALLWSPSMSLAVNLLMKLSATAGAALKDHSSGVDVEIIERHHRFKEDAPSGTALKFGEVLAGAMGLTKHQHGREGRPGQRPRDEIGYHAVREGDNPGEHTIIFGMLGETIELSVRATSRDCYAHGALTAARFLAGKPPGLYGIEDVLGL
jgi:4-hydroxy-tetrahydrodipicolinate reductase